MAGGARERAEKRELDMATQKRAAHARCRFDPGMEQHGHCMKSNYWDWTAALEKSEVRKEGANGKGGKGEQSRARTIWS